MKIFVAIESSNNAKVLANTTLRWAARAGFNMRIFVPSEKQRRIYAAFIEEANHNWYLDLPDDVVVVGKSPKRFAEENGFDLLVRLPDNLRKWKRWLNYDLNVLHYAADLGKTRIKFADPEKKVERFKNGATIERL